MRPTRLLTALRRFPVERYLAAAILLGIIAWSAWSFAQKGVIYRVMQLDAYPAENLAPLREAFAAWGPAAPLAYLGMVTTEVVVAPLPGTMLYAPGGLIFGGFWGGTIALAGNVLGAGIACRLTRSIGLVWDAKPEDGSRLRRLQGLLDRHGLWVVFLLRLNPLTSSDLVSYAAGLTPMPVWKVMTGTLLGMAPLCYAQAYLAEQIFHAFPQAIYPLLALCVLYVGLVVWVVFRLRS